MRGDKGTVSEAGISQDAAVESIPIENLSDALALRRRMVSAISGGAVKGLARTRSAFDKLNEYCSLAYKGTRENFDVAIAMISVIPVLGLAYISLVESSAITRFFVCVMALVMPMLGYTMIMRYPRTLLRLKEYMEQVAAGQVPHVVPLMRGDRDIASLEKFLGIILDDLNAKIRTIEEQKKKIVDMERRKAIMESLATTCHYIGQPATVIISYLDMLDKEKHTPETRKMLDNCRSAGAEIARILHTLNEATQWESEAYLTDRPSEGGGRDEGNGILKIEGLGGGSTER